MAGIHFQIVGDNSDFLRKLAETQRAVSATSKRIEQQGIGIDQYLSKLAKGAAALGVGFSATQLIKDIIQIRGEFQQLEIAFETMLGSKVKAETLMSQLTQTAAKTPFDLQGIANGAKQLLAYGIEAEKVNDTLVRLGNIASGLSLNLNDLVWLYGTTMTQGRLFTQDLRQFMGRGIPLAEKLAEQFGVTTDKVGELVTAGKVGFPEVQKAIEAMTNEGGKFYNLMEKQSSSLTGQISNLSDAWDMMLNEIGTKTQGIASAGIATTASLVENYDKVGKAIAAIAATYGTYKAALIAARLLENGTATARLAHIKIIQLQTAAQTALNIVTKANPYVLLATAVVGVASAMWALYDSTSAAERAQRRYNDERQKFLDHEEERRRKVGELIRTIQDETETEYSKIDAYEKLGKYSPALVEAYSREQIATLELAKSQSVLNEERDKMNYQVIISNIGKAKNAIQEYTKARQEVSLNPRSNNQVAMYTTRIEQAEADLKSWQNALSEYNRLKKQAEEDAKPVEVKLMEAESNHEQIKQEFLAAKMALEEAQEELKNTPFAVIPIDIQLRFNNAQAAFEKSNETIANLKSSQAGTEKTYRQAYKEAEDVWKAKTKAVKDAKNKSESEYLKAVKELEEAEKVYKSLGGITGAALTEEGNQAVKLQEQQRQLLELRVKNAKDYARQLEDIYLDSEQSRIDAMEEGSKKTLDQMELNHEKELLAIDREKEELIQAKINAAKAEFEAEENVKAAKNPNYKKQTFDASGIILSDTENSLFDNKYKSALDRQAKERQAYYNAEKQAMNDYLAAYGTYLEKRNAIIARSEEKKKGKNEWEQKTIDEETKQSLSDLDIEANKKTSAITKLFGDMRERTVSDMRAIADEAERAFQFLQSGEWDEKKGLEFGISKETFDTLRKSPEELEKIRKGIKEINDEADSSDTAFNKMAIGLKKVFQSGSNTKKLKEGLADIENGLNDVLQVGQFLSNTLSNLGDAFGNDTLNGVAEGINVAMDAASSAMSGAQAGAMFGPWGAAAGAAIGLVSSLGSSLAKLHDAKHEKKIQKLQDQIEVLEKNYEKLGDSVEKAYSKDASKLIDQQNTLLEQQKVLIRNQIAEEKDKKKTDWDRIKEWENQIEEINKLIEDNKEKAVDAIFGEDLKSAIDNFASAYADAWEAGEDRAKSAKDVVRDMMRQMVTESIKAAIQSSKSMEDIRKKLQEFYADNVLSGWEQDYIYNMAEQLQKELDAKFGWADNLMKDESATNQQQATSGGFETMSQDTASELNGRFTALQIAGEEIKNQSITQTSLLQMIYGLVSAIIIPAPTEQTGDDTTFMSSVPASADSGNGEVASQLISLSMATNSLLGVNQEGFNNILLQIVQTNNYLEDIYTIQKKMWEQWSRKFDEMTKSLNHAFGK